MPELIIFPLTVYLFYLFCYAAFKDGSTFKCKWGHRHLKKDNNENETTSKGVKYFFNRLYTMSYNWNGGLFMWKTLLMTIWCLMKKKKNLTLLLKIHCHSNDRKLERKHRWKHLKQHGNEQMCHCDTCSCILILTPLLLGSFSVMFVWKAHFWGSVAGIARDHPCCSCTMIYGAPKYQEILMFVCLKKIQKQYCDIVMFDRAHCSGCDQSDEYN